MTQGTLDNKAGDIIAFGTIDIQARSDIFSYTDNIIQSHSTIRLDSDGLLSISSIDAGTSSVSLLANNIVDSGTDDLDVMAAELRIETKGILGGAGDKDNRLDISVDTLTASVGKAGLYVHEIDDLIIDKVSEISVYRIANDGNIDNQNSPTDTAMSNIISRGNVDITADAGDITLDYIEAQGSINLAATAGDILETRDDTIVDLNAGNRHKITLTASGNISAHDHHEDKYIDIADNSIIAASSTTTGNIYLRAEGEGEILLNGITTTDGGIDIIGNDQMYALNLVSNGEENDGINIHNLMGDILIGSMISADQINITADQGTIADFQNDNSVDITAGDNASITLTAAKHINGINNTFLEFSDNSRITANSTTEGEIHIKGSGSLTLENIIATGGEIMVISANDMMAETIDSETNIILESTGGSIEAGHIVAGNNLTMQAAQAIVEKTGLITANDLILNVGTGIGNAAHLLTLDVNRLNVANQSTNGIFISNTKALTLSDLNENAHAIQNDSNGDIVIDILEGNLTILQTVEGHSDILLSSQSASASIHIESDILTDQGSISILSDADIKQSGNIISSGSVDIQSANGSITMAKSFSTQTQSANISYHAKGDIVIETIDAGEKAVSIYSETGNVNTNADTDDVNITAANTKIESAKAIGTSTNHLETLTDILAVKASGHIFIDDHSSVTIDHLDSQAIQRVQRDGSTLTVKDQSQLTGLVCNSEGANIVIQTLNGDLTINAFDTSIEEGNIQLLADSGTIRLNDQIASGSAQLSIIAEQSIIQNADILSSDGSVHILAEKGSITMADNISTQTQNAAIRYQAKGDIQNAHLISNDDIEIISDDGSISVHYIESQENIHMSAISGNIVDTLNDTSIDIKTGDNKLITLYAGGYIGSQDSADDIYLDVADHSTIDASSEGNINIQGAGTLILNNIQTTNGTIDLVANDQIQANHIVSNGENNSITIHNRSGDILVGSIISGNDLMITSDQGSIIDSANDNLIDITAGQNAKIVLTAAHHIHGINNTFIELAANSQVTAKTRTEGTIFLQGAGKLTLSSIDATGGDINIIAANDLIAENLVNSTIENGILHDIRLKSTSGSIESGEIVSSNKLTIFAKQAIINQEGLIQADQLLLNAGTGIGDNETPLTVNVNQLDAANRLNNGIFIINQKDLTLVDLDDNQYSIDNIGGGYIQTDGTCTVSDTVEQHDDFALLAGNNPINNGVNAQRNAAQRPGINNAQLIIEADIIHKQSGNILLQAQDTIYHYSGTILNEGGTIQITSENAQIIQEGGGLKTTTVQMIAGQKINYADGINDALLLKALSSDDITYTNQHDIYIDQVLAGGSVSITALEGSIVDDNDNQEVDIVSDSNVITLKAMHSISGIEDNMLELADNSHISAYSEGVGNIYLYAKNNLVIENAQTNEGFITINTSGQMNAQKISAQGSDNNNDHSVYLYSERGGIETIDIQAVDNIHIQTDKSNISVGSIETEKSVILKAKGGSIASFGDSHIKADHLNLESDKDIDLFTEISTIEALINGTGDLHIQEADRIDIKSIVVGDGDIEIQAKGAITVDRISGADNVSLYNSSGGMTLSQIVAKNNITTQSLSGDMHLNELMATNTVTINVDEGEILGILDSTPVIKAQTFSTNINDLSLLDMDIEMIHLQNPIIIAYKDYLKSHVFENQSQKIVLDDYFPDKISIRDTFQEAIAISDDLSWMFLPTDPIDMLSEADLLLTNSFVPFDSNALYKTDFKYEVKWEKDEFINHADTEPLELKQSEQNKPNQNKGTESSDTKESQTNQKTDAPKDMLPDSEKIEKASPPKGNQPIESKIKVSKQLANNSAIKHVSRDLLQPEKGFLSKMKSFWNQLSMGARA